MSDQITAAVFNIADFELKDTFTLEILNQKGDPMMWEGKQVTVELCGPGTREYAEATHKIESFNTAAMFAGMRAGKAPKSGVDDSLKSNAAKYAACTRSINNFPVSPSEIYLNRKMAHVTTQVAKAIEDFANF